MKETIRRVALTAILAGAGLLAVLPLSAQEAPAPKPPPPPPLPPQPARVVQWPQQRPVIVPRDAFTPLPNLNPPSFQPQPIAPAVVKPVASVFEQVAPTYGPLTALKWDAEQKEYTTKPGDMTANYTFWFTNTSDQEVIINHVRTSCGCTVAKLPMTPWPIAPETNGPVDVSIDLRGKSGTIAKSVSVETAIGVKTLIVRVNITTPPAAAAVNAFAVNHPTMSDQDRLENMQKALADRQVVFKDANCAKCHADPAKGQADGSVIYRGVCATCHDSPLRAAAVTDLKALKNETDVDYWKQWIAHGKPGSMMPAYALSEGGPLNDQQIKALAEYCVKTFQPVAARASQTPGTVTNAAATPPGISLYPVPTRK